MNQHYYENNMEYRDALRKIPSSFYAKYVKKINELADNNKVNILDIGCGTGNALSQLKKTGLSNLYGCDISSLFIESAIKKGLRNIQKYGGKKLPYRKDRFDISGSFTVLEHTDNPVNFIKEQIRVTKKKGYVIIACPNFLSLMINNNHPQTKGFRQKAINLFTIIRKIYTKDFTFKKMTPIVRDKFEPDDDATVVTNLIDISYTMKRFGIRIIYSSGFMTPHNFILEMIGRMPIVKYLLPSCFIIGIKER